MWDAVRRASFAISFRVLSGLCFYVFAGLFVRSAPSLRDAHDPRALWRRSGFTSARRHAGPCRGCGQEERCSAEAAAILRPSKRAFRRGRFSTVGPCQAELRPERCVRCWRCRCRRRRCRLRGAANATVRCSTAITGPRCGPAPGRRDHAARLLGRGLRRPPIVGGRGGRRRGGPRRGCPHRIGAGRLGAELQAGATRDIAASHFSHILVHCPPQG